MERLRLVRGYQFNPAFASEISQIHPLPHQRIAVYERMLQEDPLRFLLADDAGAGKTIMTGLYVREMLMRGRIRRVLVVPPAGLVGNWERELRTLFRLHSRIVSGPELRSGNPFAEPGGDLVVVSLDTLRGERAFAALADPEAPPYDLVVFDEAHKLGATRDGGRVRKTSRYRLAEALAGCPPAPEYSALAWSARHLLLLTATPHMGRDSPYHHLWRLLDHRVFGAEEALRRFPREDRARHFIRRTKEEMLDYEGRPIFRERRCDTFGYDLSGGPDGERELYERTTSYLKRCYNVATGNRQAVRLAMGVFQRRLASSTWALLKSLERRIARVGDLIADLESGRIDARGLERAQRRLNEAHRRDYFERRDASEDLDEDRHRERGEDYEDAVLGAVVAVTVEDLRAEIETLRDLRGRARDLVDSGRESKFERLRAVLESPEQRDEKWLVFSEHRDTADYLVRRLEALGHAGRVATIHGGMAWPEREEVVDRFRDPSGARFLIATDAAGEGINLQFCRQMVNYDIPWNPARLEQRMGRIHRYGQKHDVRIVNLVSTDTREGRVLKVLLDKLEAIRRELRSDKVFDVIGRLFENRSLRRHMREALTDEGERRARRRLEAGLTSEVVRKTHRLDEERYGRRGDVARRLGTLKHEMERERYLHLLPANVRRFVELASPLLGLAVRGELDGSFSLVPTRPGTLDPLLAALETHPADARGRLRVRRPEPGEVCVWMHPGEPVFDAMCDRVLAICGPEAARGAIFVDPRATEAYLVHLAARGQTSPGIRGALHPRWTASLCVASCTNSAAIRAAKRLASPAQRPSRCSGEIIHGLLGDVAVEEEGRRAEDGGVLAKGGEREAEDAERKTLERRLLALRQGEDGKVAEMSVEEVGLLLGVPDHPPGAVPLAARALTLRSEALGRLDTEAWRLADIRRDAVRAELPERRERVGLNFNLRVADMARRRTELSKDAEANPEELEAVKRGQRDLVDQRRLALAELDAAPARIVVGDVRFVAHALVLPPTGEDAERAFDAHVEEIAMGIAAEWERAPRAFPTTPDSTSCRSPRTVAGATSRSRDARGAARSGWRRTNGDRRASWATSTGSTWFTGARPGSLN